jgi:SAM-dependent methyltransferase
MRKLLIDRFAIQIDSYSRYRHNLAKQLLIHGPIQTLNIGTGGGVESLNMLRRGNHLTTIEIDEDAHNRTKERTKRNGYAAMHDAHYGHILDIDLDKKFHQIYMCEVLEHILDDKAVLNKIANWLIPGGRLILSTPTAFYGDFPGDPLSITEDGGHLRVGYQGPELDEMLKQVGLMTLKRIYNGNRLVQYHHFIEKSLTHYPITRYLGYLFGLMSRPFLPLLDCIQFKSYDQISLVVKL